MALYAFDGTWNEKHEEAPRETNVVKFRDAYKGTRFYQKGVGTRLGWLGKVIGGLTGAGGHHRVDAAIEQVKRNFKNNDTVIDVVGFSRGAALALDFATRIAAEEDLGASGKGPAEIRFLGLWDTVPSFGIPGNEVNLGYLLGLPPTVRKCFHAMALDERRGSFPLMRLAAKVADATREGRLYEVWFRGVHSDVGGGNENEGLSSIALHWMLKRAQSCGLDLKAEKVEQHHALMNPDAEIRPVKLDPIKDPFRTVMWTDVVHASVRRRPRTASIEHNNPPAGLQVVDDSGVILATRFGRQSDTGRMA